MRFILDCDVSGKLGRGWRGLAWSYLAAAALPWWIGMIASSLPGDSQGRDATSWTMVVISAVGAIAVVPYLASRAIYNTWSLKHLLHGPTPYLNFFYTLIVLCWFGTCIASTVVLWRHQPGFRVAVNILFISPLANMTLALWPIVTRFRQRYMQRTTYLPITAFSEDDIHVLIDTDDGPLATLHRLQVPAIIITEPGEESQEEDRPLHDNPWSYIATMRNTKAIKAKPASKAEAKARIIQESWLRLEFGTTEIEHGLRSFLVLTTTSLVAVVSAALILLSGGCVAVIALPISTFVTTSLHYILLIQVSRPRMLQRTLRWILRYGIPAIYGLLWLCTLVTLADPWPVGVPRPAECERSWAWFIAQFLLFVLQGIPVFVMLDSLM